MHFLGILDVFFNKRKQNGYLHTNLTHFLLVKFLHFSRILLHSKLTKNLVGFEG